MPSWFFSLISIIVGITCILSSYFEWTKLWRLGGVGDLMYKILGHSSMRLLYAFLGTGLIMVTVKDWLDALLPNTIRLICFAGIMAIIASLVLYILNSDLLNIKNKKKKFDTDIDKLGN